MLSPGAAFEQSVGDDIFEVRNYSAPVLVKTLEELIDQRNPPAAVRAYRHPPSPPVANCSSICLFLHRRKPEATLVSKA